MVALDAVGRGAGVALDPGGEGGKRRRGEAEEGFEERCGVGFVPFAFGRGERGIAVFESEPRQRLAGGGERESSARLGV